jgi:DNA-binding helix-hairpin-helix protein with protein kinase domain
MTSLNFQQLFRAGDLEEIGRGGEGRVFKIRSMPGMVYKEFVEFPGHVPNRAALEELIAVRNNMTSDEKNWLSDRTTWPESIVLDGSKMKGFLMPLIGANFFKRYGVRANPKTVACEWNYLSMRNKYLGNRNIYSEIPRVEPSQAVSVVLDLAKTIAILHQYEVVVGDISGRNLLWTDTPALRAMIIDCDSFRMNNRPGVSPPKQSPDWEDPELSSSLTTMRSDIYKLALAAYRAVWAATTERPFNGNSALPAAPDGVPSELLTLIEQSVKSADRPTAAEWVTDLSKSMAFDGRLAISMNGSNSKPSQPRSNVVSTKSARPIIKMKSSTDTESGS